MAFRLLDERDLPVLNKSYSNALAGKLRGAIVTADDVSPCEHEMAVKVKNKNLARHTSNRDTEDSGGIHFIRNADGTITATGTATATGYYLMQAGTGYSAQLPLPRGRYVLSKAPAQGCRIVAGVRLDESAERQLFSASYTEDLVFDIRVDTARFDIILCVDTGAVVDGVVFKPQLELGDTATEYTPYVDPAAVTVKRCGKNLIPFPYASSTQDYNGIVFTPNADGSVTINGTATGDGISFMLVNTGAGSRKFLPAGTYFLSCPELANSDVLLSLFYYDENEGTTFNGTCGKNASFTIDKPQYYGLYFRVYGGTVVNNLTVHPQLEIGDASTDYEAYNGAEYIPEADGTVKGVTSLAPNIAIFAEAEGAIIECEYTKDANAVINKLTNAIIALGGNV